MSLLDVLLPKGKSWNDITGLVNTDTMKNQAGILAIAFLVKQWPILDLMKLILRKCITLAGVALWVQVYFDWKTPFSKTFVG